MKYLVIAIKPGPKDKKKSFQLESLLQDFFHREALEIGADHHVLYLHVLVDKIESALEFLKIHEVKMDADRIPASVDKLMQAFVNHVVLELPDNFNDSMSIKALMTRAFILQPEGYIHQAINAELDEAEEGVSLLKEQMHTAKEEVLPALRKMLQAKQKKVFELHEKLAVLINASFLEFKFKSAQMQEDKVQKLKGDESPQQDRNSGIGLLRRVSGFWGIQPDESANVVNDNNSASQRYKV